MVRIGEHIVKPGWVALSIVVLAATMMRFYATAQSPAGFYRDEAAIAAHVLCLAESGRTLDGHRWPLMTPVLGGGYSTIAWQAPAVAWTSVTGGSIGGLRSFSALCGALTIAGVFFAGLFATESVAVGAYAALSAAISPWAFQFSRIAWDAAIAPAYLAIALALLLLATTELAARRRWVRWPAIVISPALFAAACLSYPPLRVQVPLVLVAVVAWKRPYVRANLAEAAAFTGIFVACMLPLLQLTQSGAIQGRFASLSVFTSSYWTPLGVTSDDQIALRGMQQFATNVVAHLSPRFLLGSGDANVRHSTQSFGEWSWLDVLALAGAALVFARRREPPSDWMRFAMFGYLAGVVPAALTWEGIPHALRSIGAFPFLALLVGTSIHRIAQAAPRLASMMPAVTAGIAFVFALAFGHAFFFEYPARSSDAFDAPVVQRLVDPQVAHALAEGDAGTLRPESPDEYPRLALRYYELRGGGARCVSSGDVLVFH